MRPFRLSPALVAAVSVVGQTVPLAADVKLPPLFADRMVVQAECPCPIWGWAAAGERITVTAGEKTAVATADAAGRWRVELPPMRPGGPYEINVRGQNELVLHDVLAGEVWLASGQSNMAWRLRQLPGVDELVAGTDLPQVRAFNVPTTGADEAQESCDGTWIACTGPATADFSAAAFYFAKKLHGELGVPVGILTAAVGGSPIEA